MLHIERLPEGTQFRLMRIARGLTLFDLGQPSLPPEAVARVRALLSSDVSGTAHEEAGGVA